MPDDNQPLVEHYRERVAQGELSANVATSLLEEGHSSIKSLQILMELFNMKLPEARIVLDLAWEEMARQQREAAPKPPMEVWPSWSDIEAARKLRKAPPQARDD